jgi:hypothetical protein
VIVATSSEPTVTEVADADTAASCHQLLASRPAQAK